ncbi:hypothetical protein V8G54_020574 [Vigna mungo]|uniref:Peptidase C1A papain C-terminal domain-containing protein n=1 Tax=Vigna mungo TaxID=3915 RepID=A0AAQ3NEI0_VIGMU
MTVYKNMKFGSNNGFELDNQITLREVAEAMFGHSQQLIVTGQMISLSEQELVDCDTGYNMRCNGGLMDYVFKFIINNGDMDSDEDYPYRAVDGTCDQYRKNAKVVSIDSYEDVNSYDELALKRPVAIEGGGREFQLYSTGVFSGRCRTTLDHGVVVVGCGTENGHDYWIVRNSWGADWGEEGYMRMERNMDNSRSGKCGIAMEPSYPMRGWRCRMKHSKFVVSLGASSCTYYFLSAPSIFVFPCPFKMTVYKNMKFGPNNGFELDNQITFTEVAEAMFGHSQPLIVTGEMISLSEQELVDCDTGYNMGCNGGLMDYAFEFIINNGGIHSEEDYPYRVVDGTCDHVAIEGGGREFELYSSGVFSGRCGTALDHGVVADGNSWGADWGEEEYMRMERNMGNSRSGKCGIAIEPPYPIRSSPNRLS